MDTKQELDMLIMELFSLKGKTGYSEFDVATWRKHLQRFQIKDIKRAFSVCLKKEGFFEIKMVLEELEPNNRDWSFIEWENCVESARNGGAIPLSCSAARALRIAGGMNKLRFTDSEFTLNRMREIFIEAYDITKKDYYKQMEYKKNEKLLL